LGGLWENQHTAGIVSKSLGRNYSVYGGGAVIFLLAGKEKTVKGARQIRRAPFTVLF
jgi:hypothetical protein